MERQSRLYSIILNTIELFSNIKNSFRTIIKSFSDIIKHFSYRINQFFNINKSFSNNKKYTHFLYLKNCFLILEKHLVIVENQYYKINLFLNNIKCININ